MNLLYLKYFCDAVKQKSISASAKINFVSQSAISQGIAKLESFLGQDLITHQQNRFQITQEGQHVFERGIELLKNMQDLKDSMNVQDGVFTGKIDFACMHSFALAVLPTYLKQAQQKWPNLHVNFRLGHTDIIKTLIKNGIVDFGIVLDNEDLSAFDCREIGQGEYRLYVSSKVQDHKKLDYILSEERMETNLLKAAFKSKFKKELPVQMEIASWEVIASLTEEGLGIGFFPDYIALKRNRLLKSIDLGLKPIPYKVLAIFPKSKKAHRNSDAFLSLFQ